MIKDPKIFIAHMLENIADIETFLKGVKKEGFLANKEKQNAVVRSLEIIGEASKNIPTTIKTAHPSIPWKEIAGTRDKITHHYFGVDLQLIWNLTQKEIPKLKKDLLKIL
jgi:uncharacterized protein with HEPN domain